MMGGRVSGMQATTRAWWLMAMAMAMAMTVLTAGACSKDNGEKRGSEAGTESSAEPPKIRVHPDNADLAFRFFDTSTGTFKTVGAVEDVPEEVRSAVLVFDVSAPPAPPTILYVADLTASQADGTYPYRTVDRYRYEDGIVVVPEGAGKGARPKVTVYSAEWCGACKQAKRWLESKKIPYLERDVEKDPKALSAMAEDARRAGVSPESLGGGVPVIVVGDKIFSGFNPQEIERALGG